MTRTETKLRLLLRELVDLYVKNQDSEYEFISCVTAGRKTMSCKYWRAWMKAKKILKSQGVSK